MAEFRKPSRSEKVLIDDLATEFLSLRVGEIIPRLKIKEIRKVINKGSQNNLSGVDYRYIIESTDGKLLTVNSWILWKQIARVLREANQIQVTLELRHPAVEHYSVKRV